MVIGGLLLHIAVHFVTRRDPMLAKQTVVMQGSITVERYRSDMSIAYEVRG